MHSISEKKQYVSLETICDYVPIVSTGANLLYLFQKCRASSSVVPKSRHYQTLEQKSFARCFTLLIPFIGNLIIGIYDWRSNNKAHMLDSVKKDGCYYICRRRRSPPNSQK